MAGSNNSFLQRLLAVASNYVPKSGEPGPSDNECLRILAEAGENAGPITAADITDSTEAGRAMLMAADAAAQAALIGAAFGGMIQVSTSTDWTTLPSNSVVYWISNASETLAVNDTSKILTLSNFGSADVEIEGSSGINLLVSPGEFCYFTFDGNGAPVALEQAVFVRDANSTRSGLVSTGTQQFAGAKEFLSPLTVAAATSGGHAMNRDTADSRYSKAYHLSNASDLTSNSTGYVESSESITVPAGVYLVQSSLLIGTASSTGGMIGDVYNTTGTHSSSGTGQRQATTIENASVIGTPEFRQYWATSVRTAGSALGDATFKTALGISTMRIVISSESVIKLRIAQRSATDAANPVYMRSGSYSIWTKL